MFLLLADTQLTLRTCTRNGKMGGKGPTAPSYLTLDGPAIISLTIVLRVGVEFRVVIIQTCYTTIFPLRIPSTTR